jgi:putative transposase
VGVTGHPTEQWVAQQLREATPFGTALNYLIRDNDSKFGATFDQVAAGVGIQVLRTPFQAPKANAFVERFIGSVRRECLDHLVVLGEQHLVQVMNAYVQYFNTARPRQGIHQQLPANPVPTLPPPIGKLLSFPILGGLHHRYEWVA